MSVSGASSFDAQCAGVQSLPNLLGVQSFPGNMDLEGSRRSDVSATLSRGVTPNYTPATRAVDTTHSPRTQADGHSILVPQSSAPSATGITSATTAIPVVHSSGSLTPAKHFASVPRSATPNTVARLPLVSLRPNNSAAASQVMTPSLSGLTTPRCDPVNWAGGTGKVRLTTFDSLAATPCANASHGVDAAATETQGNEPRDVRTPILGPNKQDEAARSYATLAEADSDKEDERENGGQRGRHRRSHHDDEDSVNYNSFAGPLESSFISDGSIGGDGARVYTTLGRATFHIFKGNVGAGVFLLPTYYQDAGYLLGGICVGLLGLIMMDCVMVLLRSKTRIAHAEVRTYPAVVEYVLGYWFRQFTKFALIFTQFGFCIIFVQYASSMFSPMFRFPLAYQVCVVASIVLVTPMTFMSNNMQRLAYISLLAGVFVGLVLAGTTVIDIQYIATQGIAPAALAAIPTMRIIVFLSGHMFSLEGIGVVLPVENSVAPENRLRFIQLVKYTLGAIVSLYIVFGILGYLAYGENLHTSVVLALPPSVFKTILQVLLGLSLLLGYPIQYVPAIQLVDKSLGVSELNDKKKSYAVRVGLNVLFGLFALFIGSDTINIFASFLGAFVGVHLMITIPTLLALQLEHALSGARDDLSYGAYLMLMFRGPYNATKIRYFVYLVIAAFVWVAGMYYTVASVFAGVPSSTPTTPPSPPPNTTSAPIF